MRKLLKTVAVFLFFLAFFPIFAGCSRDLPAQADAVCEMLEQMEGYPVFVGDADLQGMLREQDVTYRDGAQIYVLELQRYDVTALDPEVLGVQAPSYEPARVTLASYWKKYHRALSASLLSAFEGGLTADAVPVRTEVGLRKTKDGYIAFLTHEGREMLVDAYAADIDAIIARTWPGEENMLRAAMEEVLRLRLADVLPVCADLMLAHSHVEAALIASDNTVRVAFCLPRADAVCESGAAFYSEYVGMSATELSFGEAELALVAEEVLRRENMLECIEFTLHFDAPVSQMQQEIGCSIEGLDAFAREQALAWEDALSRAADAVNAVCYARPQNPDRAQIIAGESRGCTVYVENVYELENVYVRFFKCNAAGEAGPMQLSVYVPAGQKIKAKLPAGSYLVYTATGGTWYGETIMFGPEGDYTKDMEPWRIKGGYYYTLSCGVVNGNMNSDNIPYTPDT